MHFLQPARALAELICPPECLWCEALLRPASKEPPAARDQPVSTNQPISQGYRVAWDFCGDCHGKLVSDYHRCQKCATPIPAVVPNADCHRCRSANWRFDRVLTLGPYRDRLREVVIRMKKPSQDLLRRGVGRLLADQAADHFSDFQGEEPLIIPVPNFWTHAIFGVADAAGDLARHVARETGFPCRTDTVRRIRKTAKQGMLSWSERTENVRGAFKIPRAGRLTARHVILVDDVLTSGATCAEIASRLKKAGVASVTVLVAARGTGARETHAVEGDRTESDAT